MLNREMIQSIYIYYIILYIYIYYIILYYIILYYIILYYIILYYIILYHIILYYIILYYIIKLFSQSSHSPIPCTTKHQSCYGTSHVTARLARRFGSLVARPIGKAPMVAPLGQRCQLSTWSRTDATLDHPQTGKALLFLLVNQLSIEAYYGILAYFLNSCMKVSHRFT